MTDESPARITRVVLKNYKSIVHCDVELGPLTLLVGPNGSGKSNFVDALRFIGEVVTGGLQRAVLSRGGIERIRSQSSNRNNDPISVEIYFKDTLGATGRYGIDLSMIDETGLYRHRERFLGENSAQKTNPAEYTIDFDRSLAIWRGFELDRSLVSNLPSDLILLTSLSGTQQVISALSLLTGIVTYNLELQEMRSIRPSLIKTTLLHDGANISDLVREMATEAPELLERISAYLSHISPGVEGIEVRDLGPVGIVELVQRIGPDGAIWRPWLAQVSDGTLHALGVLVALFQGRLGAHFETSVVGIEEPESGLHPAAADVLFNALLDAAYTTQVLVTTHSADLLQSSDLKIEQLLAVVAENGVTQIGPIDDVSRSVLRDKLFTAGDLLQMKQLRPKVLTNGSKPDVASLEPTRAI